MKIDPITVSIAVVALIFLLWLISKITRSIKPMSKKEADQQEIVKRISEQPNPGRKRKGYGWLIVIIILIILLFSWIWLGKEFHP